MNITNKVAIVVTRTVLNVIGWFSPRAKKCGSRIIFVGSVGGLLSKQGVTDINSEVLCDVVDKQYVPEVFEIGEILAHDIWDDDRLGTSFVDTMTTALVDKSLPDREDFVDTVLMCTPSWLQYDVRDMRRDLHSLLVRTA